MKTTTRTLPWPSNRQFTVISFTANSLFVGWHSYYGLFELSTTAYRTQNCGSPSAATPSYFSILVFPFKPAVFYKSMVLSNEIWMQNSCVWDPSYLQEQHAYLKPPYFFRNMPNASSEIENLRHEHVRSLLIIMPNGKRTSQFDCVSRTSCWALTQYKDAIIPI